MLSQVEVSYHVPVEMWQFCVGQPGCMVSYKNSLVSSIYASL